MERKKRATAAVIILVFFLAGGMLTKANSKFAEQEEVNLILAMSSQSSLEEGADTFAQLCEEYSEGKITVDVFPDNILGDDKLVVEGAQIGDIDIAISSTSPLAVMYNDYYLFDAPYLFLSEDEVYNVGFDGEAGQKVADGVESIGLKNLAMWENGFRDLTNDSVAVHTPEQLKGMKIRTMENSIHLAAWKALGANPTPMAFTEVFTALQQGTVDGEENPIGLIESNKFYEVQEYITLTEHVYTPYCVLMNLEKWDSLTEEQQDVIERAMEEATRVQIQASQDFEEEAVRLMEESGCTVIELTEEEKKEFQDVIIEAGVYELAKDNMEHPEYFDQMVEELEEYRGK